MGGIESVRVIHRGAAIIMMLETIYHVGVVGYRVFVRRSRLTMLPDLQDVRVALHALLHNLGLRRDRPQQGRYTFEEKAEYWALVLGGAVMILTGFIQWFPMLVSRWLPGAAIPVARAMHS